MNLICKYCNQKFHSHNFDCPVLAKINIYKKIDLQLKKDFFGEAPNVFVGKYGYPNINVGILSTNKYENHDDPLLWSKENFESNKIISLRSELVNSRFNAHIKSNDKIIDITREISLSKKPVDVEINLKEAPKIRITLGADVMPHGPAVDIQNAQITQNVHIPTKVDKVVNDELKAAESLDILSRSGFDEHYLTKIFSLGNLGIKEDKKIVPTRWSITAVDDTIGKKIIREIHDKTQIGYSIYFGGLLGNYFLVMFFPEMFSYELYEMFVGKSDTYTTESEWNTDYEDFNGRKEYATETAGGYYAARIAVLEKLKGLNKCGSALVLRFITDDYSVPLGVWVVRNATRNSLNSKQVNFSTREEMMNYAKIFIRNRFNYDIGKIIKSSKILNNSRQKSLSIFFKN